MGLADIPINTIKEFSAFGINVIVPSCSGIITTSGVVLADRQRLQFIDDLLCNGIRHEIIRRPCREKDRDDVWQKAAATDCTEDGKNQNRNQQRNLRLTALFTLLNSSGASAIMQTYA